MQYKATATTFVAMPMTPGSYQASGLASLPTQRIPVGRPVAIPLTWSPPSVLGSSTISAIEASTIRVRAETASIGSFHQGFVEQCVNPGCGHTHHSGGMTGLRSLFTPPATRPTFEPPTTTVRAVRSGEATPQLPTKNRLLFLPRDKKPDQHPTGTAIREAGGERDENFRRRVFAKVAADKQAADARLATRRAIMALRPPRSRISERIKRHRSRSPVVLSRGERRIPRKVRRVLVDDGRASSGPALADRTYAAVATVPADVIATPAGVAVIEESEDDSTEILTDEPSEKTLAGPDDALEHDCGMCNGAYSLVGSPMRDLMRCSNGICKCPYLERAFVERELPPTIERPVCDVYDSREATGGGVFEDRTSRDSEKERQLLAVGSKSPPFSCERKSPIVRDKDLEDIEYSCDRAAAAAETAETMVNEERTCYVSLTDKQAFEGLDQPRNRTADVGSDVATGGAAVETDSTDEIVDVPANFETSPDSGEINDEIEETESTTRTTGQRLAAAEFSDEIEDSDEPIPFVPIKDRLVEGQTTLHAFWPARPEE